MKKRVKHFLKNALAECWICLKFMTMMICIGGGKLVMIPSIPMIFLGLLSATIGVMLLLHFGKELEKAISEIKITWE